MDVDDYLHQIANLAMAGAKTGQFPGAQQMQSQIQGGAMPPGAPQPPAAPAAAQPPASAMPAAPAPPPGPAPAVAPQPQAGPAPQRIPYPAATPAPQASTGQGLMGFLGNPLVTGALTGYLNAISTPRYAGRGTAIARGGLGFLSGMAGAGKALSEQEEEELKNEKTRQEIDATKRYNVALDNIGQGTANDEDYVIAKAYEFKKDKETRQDIATTNQVNGMTFQQTHPGQLGSLIGGAMMKNTSSVATLGDAEESYQKALKDPYVVPEILLNLQGKRQEIAASQATVAGEQAALPGKQAESEIAQLKAETAKGMTPKERAAAFWPKAEKEVQWVQVDKDNKPLQYHYSVEKPDDEPGGTWMQTKDYKTIAGEARMGAKENLVTFYDLSDPTKTKLVDLNKGKAEEELKDFKNPARWSPGVLGKKTIKTYWDEKGNPQTIDLNVELPQRNWSDRPPRGAKEKSPEDLAAEGERISKGVVDEYKKTHGDRPSGIFASAAKQRAWDVGLAREKRAKGIDPRTNRYLPGWAGEGKPAPSPTPTLAAPSPTAAPTPSAAAAAPSPAPSTDAEPLPPGMVGFRSHDGKIWTVDAKGKEHYYADDPGPSPSSAPSPVPPS
jgi:hypothetical protein